MSHTGQRSEFNVIKFSVGLQISSGDGVLVTARAELLVTHGQESQYGSDNVDDKC